MSFQETKRLFNKQNKRDFHGKVKVVNRLKDDFIALCKTIDHETPKNHLV